MRVNLQETDRQEYHTYFEALFKVYFMPLILHAKGFVHDEKVAEDLVQDLFLNIWENRETFDFTGPVRAYLYRAVRNKCLNYLEHLKVENSYKTFNDLRIKQLELYTDDFIEKHVGLLLEEELQNRLQRAIDSMPPRCRETYLLSREENLSNQEIAAKMGISKKAVERNMTRALKIIRKNIGDYIALLALLAQLLK